RGPRRLDVAERGPGHVEGLETDTAPCQRREQRFLPLGVFVQNDEVESGGHGPIVALSCQVSVQGLPVKFRRWRGRDHYSDRSAAIGSTCAARRAGSDDASNAAAARMMATAP